MSVLALALGALAVFLLLAYFQVPLIGWTVAVGLLALVARAIADLGVTGMRSCSRHSPSAPILNIPSCAGVVTDPILAVYRRILPDMSQTEQEAIDAGTVWWDGELFSRQARLEQAARHARRRASRAEEQALPRRPGRGAVRDVRRLGDHARAARTCRRRSGSSSRTRASSA